MQWGRGGGCLTPCGTGCGVKCHGGVAQGLGTPVAKGIGKEGRKPPRGAPLQKRVPKQRDVCLRGSGVDRSLNAVPPPSPVHPCVLWRRRMRRRRGVERVNGGGPGAVPLSPSSLCPPFLPQCQREEFHPFVRIVHSGKAGSGTHCVCLALHAILTLPPAGQL